MNDPILEITFEERAEIARDLEPVTFGVPFPQRLMIESSGLEVVDDEGNFVSSATIPIARWADGSIKWTLFDLQLSMPARGKKCLKVHPGKSGIELKEKETEGLNPIELNEGPGKILVRTGETEFILDSSILLPFIQINIGGEPRLLENSSRILLTDEKEKVWTPRIVNWSVKTQNPLRMILAFEGPFVSMTQ